MRKHSPCSPSVPVPGCVGLVCATVHWAKLLLLNALAVLLAALCGTTLHAQTPNQITRQVDLGQLRTLPSQHPLWASAANDLGAVSGNQSLPAMTIVLARSAGQEQALDQLLAEQENPASPAYHQWLTPEEFGQRFGLSDQDLTAVTGWLQSQGLRVSWVSPSRMFVGFTGTAADVGRAFGTEVHSYRVNGRQLTSVNSDPTIPQALAPAIRSVRGLYSVEDRPLNHLSTPQLTVGAGTSTLHFIAPADFNSIYDVPASLTGAGETIGIAAESRTDMADFSYFRQQTGASFNDPTEVVPTAFGGADPGPAYSSPPTDGGSADLQTEATLDVQRAGSVAPGANLLVVAASTASGGVAADAQYLVQTSPAPAQVMNISFGDCESSAGPSGVAYWDALFQQAAAEGISVFVSSGDSGVAGCDTAFATPPSSPQASSPNAICSSSYATCVGGTEFNDADDPASYWNSANSTGLLSVLGYIPEGGWNEPDPSGTMQVAASGGGVSAYNTPAPVWQTGTGVPAARAGRYTPDVSFSSSCHDGYFGCMAAAGGSCAPGSSGSYYFVSFCGTSAAAPSMAGVAALLNQKLGVAQGSLNSQLYQQATTNPAAFHDATVSTSGVGSCSVNTPSMCNNSIPGPSSLTGGQSGYLLTDGYDEVTGLGSLDVGAFLNNYAPKATPTVTVNASSTSITTTQTLSVTVTVSGGSGNPAPTGTVILSSGTYASAATTLSGGSATVAVAAGALSAGTDTLTASYTPDAPGANTYLVAAGTQTVSVTATGKTTPAVTVSASPASITTAQSTTVTITVAATSGNPTPSGTVTLSSGRYISTPTTLSGGTATITIAAGTLAAGSDTLTASYAPDSSSSAYYSTASGTSSVTVGSKATPAVTVSASPASITTSQSTTVTVTVAATSGNPTPTGTVTVSSGSYTSAATALSGGKAAVSIAAGALAAGSDTITANYTPDSTSTAYYNSASGTSSITVGSKATPAVTVSAAPASITTSQSTTVTVTVASAGGYATPTGTVTVSSGSYTSAATALSGGKAAVSIAAGALAAGSDTLTASYTPDSSSSAYYNDATGTSSVTVGAKATPAVTVSASPASITTSQSTTVTVTVAATSGNPTPTGTVTLSSGSYTSVATTLSGGKAAVSIAAGALAAGSDTITANYTPDS
ncbi:MAG TPA: Ig-like domain repeat protein, partial [Terracidiphilus sp.]|nr:Ig-like domain repeat protein [Terracidiphilus sp.]